MLGFAARLMTRPAFLCGVLALSMVAASWLWVSTMLGRPGPHNDDSIVIITAGSGHASVRWDLQRAGVLHQMYHYDAARMLAGDNFVPKAGEFLLPAGASLRQVMDILHKGKSLQRRLTIVEGQTSAEIVASLDAIPGLTGSVAPLVDEGSLYPDTYFYTYATARVDVISRMQDKMQITLAEAWASRQPDLPYKTPDEALIMASIIEKEAASKADRQLVAAVLVNRMKRGMRLQSDPTVRYGIDVETDRPISKADLRRKTPWNTYVITGLPKTPICNPGFESIDAALHPADSDFLYFVSDGFGGLRFAKTLDVHNKNVRLFRAIEAQNPKGPKP
ncbi:MAG: endolytic transglycosylase MltG [Candidatus Puniceispirillaceae bacterium]|jgi:UPF0755 protein